MVDETPLWLLNMRALTGLVETPGNADNPKILAMRDTIARSYPDMASYCAGYVHDSTPWCGLTVAYCMTEADIRPVWGPTDTDRWLWAKSWKNLQWGYELDQPRLGCIVVMTREGGGHVTLYERTEGTSYVCRGGNQGDAVNTKSFPISSVISLMWPKTAGAPSGDLPKRELKEGDTGSDVVYLQTALGIPADGEFGEVTDAAVKGFQTANGLTVDGEVGPQTWAKVDDLVARKSEGDDGLPDELKQAVSIAAHASSVQKYKWADRGNSPPGYINGIGESFALALMQLDAGNAAAIEMAQAAGKPDTDALAYYSSEFAALQMDNSRPGADTLRHLFVLMIGLGMRESSGKYCEGRDMSATNTTSDTCEAGLFQTSWNISTSSVNIPKLLDQYWIDPNGFLPIFAENIEPTVNNLNNYGSGQGAMYQWLSKYCPAFTTMVTAIGLRKRRSHWGPIGRKEVEIVQEADDFLKKVADLVKIAPAPPVPIPPEEPENAVMLNIETKGDVHLYINGKLWNDQ